MIQLTEYANKEGNIMDHFELVSKYKPTGDQPEAIEGLAQGLLEGLKEQVLLGVTGSGINAVQR